MFRVALKQSNSNTRLITMLPHERRAALLSWLPRKISTAFKFDSRDLATLEIAIELSNKKKKGTDLDWLKS